MGPTPCYSQSQIVSVSQIFRPVARFFFPAKYNFLGGFFFLGGGGGLGFFLVFLLLLFFKYRKGVWPHRCAFNIPW